MKDMNKNGDEMKPGDGISGGGIECERVLDLAPTYADGELSGDLAGSVRAHLLDCSPCRLAVQAHVSLGAWFVPTAEVPVPEGFASRVTELAFSGASAGSIAGSIAGSTAGSSPGVQPEEAAEPFERQLTLTPRAPQPGAAPKEATQELGRLLSFSVALTAAAAAAALLLTLFLASREEPGVGEKPLVADELIERNLEALRQKHRTLTEAAQDPVTHSEDGK